MTTTTSRTFARALTAAAALVLATSLFSVATPQASAVTSAQSGSVSTAQRSAPQQAASKKTTRTATSKRSFSSRVVSIAASRRGKPYAYGGVGPSRFDCSGLTMWTFKKLGRKLPHSSSAQYGRTKHIRAKDRRRGDLVFFHGSGGIYHVGIYAGKNMIWHAPYSGTRVRKERIWTSAVSYGRVR